MRIAGAFLLSVIAMSAACLLLAWVGILIIPVVWLSALLLGLPAFLLMQAEGQRGKYAHMAVGSLISLPVPLLLGYPWIVAFGIALGAFGGYVYWWSAIHVPSRPDYARTDA